MFIEITKVNTDDGGLLYIIHEMNDLTKPLLVLEEHDFFAFKDIVNLTDSSPSTKTSSIEQRVISVYKSSQGSIISAIKEYRNLTNLGLKESKDAVEKIIASFTKTS